MNLVRVDKPLILVFLGFQRGKVLVHCVGIFGRVICAVRYDLEGLFPGINFGQELDRQVRGVRITLSLVEAGILFAFALN